MMQNVVENNRKKVRTLLKKYSGRILRRISTRKTNDISDILIEAENEVLEIQTILKELAPLVTFKKIDFFYCIFSSITICEYVL